MVYREIIAVCSEIHTKHINTLCGQNVELVNVKLAVHIVTTGLQRVNSVIKTSQLMLYREIIAVCSQIHIKHINTLCGQNVELCCSVYCLCVNVYCTTATGCQPNCSQQNISISMYTTVLSLLQL